MAAGKAFKDSKRAVKFEEDVSVSDSSTTCCEPLGDWGSSMSDFMQSGAVADGSVEQNSGDVYDLEVLFQMRLNSAT